MEALLALILFIGMGAAVFLINALHKRWAWRDAIRKADIDMQIASLRRHADHAVQHRPRVRANGCAATPGHIKATPRPEQRGHDHRRTQEGRLTGTELMGGLTPP